MVEHSPKVLASEEKLPVNYPAENLELLMLPCFEPTVGENIALHMLRLLSFRFIQLDFVLNALQT